MADAMKGTPMYESYMVAAPHPEDFPKLLDRMGELMSQPFDWSDDIAKLTMPVMLVYGDSDMYRPDHTVDFYRRLGGGLKDASWQREHQSLNRLAILPDVTHYDIFLDPDLARAVLPFLDDKRESHSWTGHIERGHDMGPPRFEIWRLTNGCGVTLLIVEPIKKETADASRGRRFMAEPVRSSGRPREHRRR